MRRMLLPFLFKLLSVSFFGMHQPAMRKRPKNTNNRTNEEKKIVIFGFSRGRNRSEAYQSEHMYSMRHKVNNQRLFILLFYPKQLQFLLVFMVFSLLNRSFLSFCLSHSLWILAFGSVRPRWLAGWLAA